jgi:transcription initiation factor TFIIIB Brf1 subunit/transcription initiation factor TFIIB
MDLLKEFSDNVPDITDEEIEELIKINKPAEVEESGNICVDCKVPMYINIEQSLYVCNLCQRSAKYMGEAIAEMNINHKVTISSNGKAYLAGDANTIEDGVRRELAEMNNALNNQIHYSVIDKIFEKLITIRLHIVNRGKVRNSIRAKCTIDICRKNGVLIADEAIYMACGISNKKINDGIRMMDYAYIAGVVDEDKEDEDETEQLVDTTIKNLDFSANQRNLLVLYIRQHQKLADINRKPISRIAGAMHYMNIVLEMGISRSDISKLTSVSESTIDQICKEYIIINDKLKKVV